jgi:hypothetical protein
MNCGRVRKQTNVGFTQILDEELQFLKVGILNLKEGSCSAMHPRYAQRLN